VFDLRSLKEWVGLRIASVRDLGEKVRAAVKTKIESRSRGRQKPVLRTSSERAMHSMMSPER